MSKSTAILSSFLAGSFLVAGCSKHDVASDSAESVIPTPQVWSERYPEYLPTLAQFLPEDEERNLTLSVICHVLLFYGLGETDLPFLPTGELALKVLTDERTAVQMFGSSPFVRTRNGLRYYTIDDPLRQTEFGESHRDQVLATFAAMDFPLSTPIHLEAGTYSVADMLSESVANFSFEQREPAWTAMAYAKYLPPQREWINRFGKQTSFSQLTNHLLTLDIVHQSCAGTHIFQALCQTDQADRQFSVLDRKTRRKLDSHLRTIILQIVKNQDAAGYWTRNWSGSIHQHASPPMPLKTHILVTGHLLEALIHVASSHQPSRDVFIHAVEWMKQSLVSDQLSAGDASWVCPFTHADLSLRKLLQYSRPIAMETRNRLPLNHRLSEQQKRKTKNMK